eukprot:m.51750 g.51750  ORF g.51750 m.51750 type:complete len:489 (+) comp10751_c0_seq1:508-1974(+)
MLLQTDPTMQGSPRSDSGGGTLLISSKEKEFVVSSPMDRRSRSGSTSSRGSTSSGNKSSRRMLYEKQVGRVEGGLAAGKKSLKTDKKKRDHGGSSWSLGSHYSGDSSTTAADLESVASDGTSRSLDSLLHLSKPDSDRGKSRSRGKNSLHGRSRRSDSGRGKDLPPGWSMRYTPEGKPYFVDEINRTTTWLDPRTNRPACIGTQHKQGGEPGPDMKKLQQEWSLPLPEGWEIAFTKNNTPYYIDHKRQTTTWTDPRSVLFRNSSWEGHQQRMKMKQLRQAQDELKYQIEVISQQQKALEQEVLQSATPETLALAKIKAMADAQQILEEQYREAECRYESGTLLGTKLGPTKQQRSSSQNSNGSRDTSRDSRYSGSSPVPRNESTSTVTDLTEALPPISPTNDLEGLLDLGGPSPPPESLEMLAAKLEQGVKTEDDTDGLKSTLELEAPFGLEEMLGSMEGLSPTKSIPGGNDLLSAEAFDEYLGSWCV